MPLLARRPDAERKAFIADAVAKLVGRGNVLYDVAVDIATDEWALVSAPVVKSRNVVSRLHPSAHDLEEQAKLLQGIADKQVPALRRGFYRHTVAVREAIDMEALLRAVESGNTYAILGVLRPTKVDSAIKPEIEKAALDITNDAVGRPIYMAYTDTAAEFGSSTLSFDLINSYAVQYAVERTNLIIAGLTHEQTMQVQTILARIVAGDYGPTTAAAMMRDVTGLGAVGARAVENYRLGLEAQLGAGASLREAAKLEGAARALASEQLRGATSVDDLVSRYADRWVAYRADMISRTETMRAANQGSLASWRVAAQQGLISPSASNIVWYTAEDDTVCDECADLDQQVVGFSSGDNFGADPEAGIVGVDAPPLHPNCRCIVTLDAEMPTEFPSTGLPDEEPVVEPAPEEDTTADAGSPENAPPADVEVPVAADEPQIGLPDLSWIPGPDSGFTASAFPWDEGLPDDMTSPTKIERWFVDKWGLMDNGTDRSISLAKFGGDGAREIASQLDALFKEYPEVAQRIQVVGTSSEVQTFARYGTLEGKLERSKSLGLAGKPFTTRAGEDRLGGIGWSQSWFKDKDVAERAAYQFSQHFWSSGDPGSIVAHEFGHQVGYLADVVYRDSVPLGDLGRETLWNYFDKEVSAALDMSNPASPFYRELMSPNERYLSKQFIKENLGTYATTNIDEMMAEAFAEVRMRGDEARPLARAIFNAMEKALRLPPELLR